MEMHVVPTGDNGDPAAPRDAARYGRAAAMSRRRALAAAGRSALATTHPTDSTPRRMVVAADGVPPARLARAVSMQRRRQLSQVWNTHLARQSRDARLLRLELHPGDADHPDILRCWTDLLAQALCSRVPLRLGEAAMLARRLV